MAVRLHVNVDHVATVRNARGTPYPDPVQAALTCEQAGAQGITVHLREDRRHVRDDDVERLRVSVTTLLNLECAVTDEMAGVVSRVRPDVVTLVPERREERTTEGGLDVTRAPAALERIRRACEEHDLHLSLFVEPEVDVVERSHALGARQVELHTGRYCEARGRRRAAELERLRRAAARARELGLEVAAGHGLTRHNLVAVAALPEVAEMNIGHALVADALFLGLAGAVRAFQEAIARGVALRERPA